ncbi:hypothetical protein V6Z11_D09G252500 [Gossypium hirsutum]
MGFDILDYHSLLQVGWPQDWRLTCHALQIFNHVFGGASFHLMLFSFSSFFGSLMLHNSIHMTTWHYDNWKMLHYLNPAKHHSSKLLHNLIPCSYNVCNFHFHLTRHINWIIHIRILVNSF